MRLADALARVFPAHVLKVSIHGHHQVQLIWPLDLNSINWIEFYSAVCLFAMLTVCLFVVGGTGVRRERSCASAHRSIQRKGRLRAPRLCGAAQPWRRPGNSRKL